MLEQGGIQKRPFDVSQRGAFVCAIGRACFRPLAGTCVGRDDLKSSVTGELALYFGVREEAADGFVVVDAPDRLGQDRGDGESFDLAILMVCWDRDRVGDKKFG